MNEQIFIEYDNEKLSNLSNNLYDLFKKNNYSVELLNNSLTMDKKINMIKKSNKKNFILSNKINNAINNAIEIIYPLRFSDEVAKIIANQLINYNVTKYYQLRASNNTALDYYEILRDINNNQGIIIKYGSDFLNDKNLPNIIFQAINNYLNEENIYTVKSGDSLYAIAKKFNTSVDDIKKLNNLTSNSLSIGQKLIISNNDSNNENTNNSSNIYTVKSGDSLYAIAKKFNTTVDDIKKLNNLTSNNLSIGQKLIISNNDSNNENTNNSSNIYTVKSGDSLYAIAKKFNTTVDDIKKLNNLTSNNLSIGQKLIISNNENNTENTNNSSKIYIVKSGDSLYAIAKKFNTTVDDIKKLNNLTNNNLSIGQKLLLENV